jgi:hypothetical protein
MNIALFLGAGASVPFGKPVTKVMKEKLLNADTQNNQTNDILHSLLTTQAFYDVEYVLQAIRDMKKIKDTVAAPFLSRVNSNFQFNFGGISFEGLLNRLGRIEEFIEDQVYEEYRWNNEYDEVLAKIYGRLFDFIAKHSEIHVFTTNYDRAMEMYCEIEGSLFQCIDGFQRASPYSDYARWMANFEFERKTNQRPMPVRLYKLHGSLNWKYHKQLGVVKTSEESISSDNNYTRNIVVMPTLSPKDEEVEEPFHTLRSLFENYMKTADVCIVIGFSFRDNLHHIFNEFIARGKTLIVISPTAISDFHKNLLKETPSQSELDAWKTLAAQTILKSTNEAKDNDRAIHLVQLEMKSDNLDGIIRHLSNIIDKLK